jgi:hypothetical protein
MFAFLCLFLPHIALNSSTVGHIVDTCPFSLHILHGRFGHVDLLCASLPQFEQVGFAFLLGENEIFEKSILNMFITINS